MMIIIKIKLKYVRITLSNIPINYFDRQYK